MSNGIDRRAFLNRGAAAGFIISGGLSKAWGAETKSGATVDTNSGKIRGLVQDKVNVFKGVPYGAPTGGANRFMPAVKPTAWTGVKDTMEWGLEAPQGHPHTEIPEVAATIPPQEVSEDCLKLNVWTNGLAKTDKRPVMVWFHGGGFFSGSGNYSIYDGANLARRRDVVVVTVNHRLNSFGFLYLAEIGGPKFATASNVGILDGVAALQWVRDNIANFGGDPTNVTIFGQSGGGAKVSTLMAMPAAKGLFHRAIVQSGAGLTGMTRDAANKAAQALMAKLNVKTAEDLQRVPMDQLIKATEGGQAYSPVVDGKTLPRDPFAPDATPLSADIPLLVGSVETEVTFFPTTQMDPIDDATLLARVKKTVNATDDQAKNLIALYRKGRPGVSNIDVDLITASDNGFRSGVLTQAERKSAQKAPVYMYYFTWRSPVHDGKLKAFHTVDIPFAMNNVDNGKSMTGTGQDRYPLEDKMSAAWVAFARTGNPSHKGLPNWPAFNATQRATMILNKECTVVNDPNKAERLALAALRKA